MEYEYRIAFAKIAEKGEPNPLTAETFVRPWTWDAICEIAKRNGDSLRATLARAVRYYAIAEGFNAPDYRGNPAGSPGRSDLIAKIRKILNDRRKAWIKAK